MNTTDIKLLDTSHTREIVCPHCGYQHHHSNEYSIDKCEFDNKCGKCGEMFFVLREISIDYSTFKKKC